MKLFRTKHYREVPCKACDGKGVLKTVIYWDKLGDPNDIVERKIDLCKGCKGKGTQTVLEKVE